ncbi:MAG: sugar phosphate isomerase/epimerase family protein [Spirochaetia bacterium]
MKPIALQLYSVRDEAKKDFPAVLKKVAGMGYKGVEPAGFHGLSPAEFRRIVEDLGMEISSSHGPWANPENLSEVIETVKILGIDLVACGFGDDHFNSMDAIKKTAEKVNQMHGALKKEGIRLFVHNHYWEFDIVDGEPAYYHFTKLAPDVLLELDVYWAANFGRRDPAAETARFKNRIPLLHIKDGQMGTDKIMQPLGQGKMDIPSVINAADPAVLEWIIVELDRCDGDMMEAVEESYRYLAENGLGAGNR